MNNTIKRVAYHATNFVMILFTALCITKLSMSVQQLCGLTDGQLLLVTVLSAAAVAMVGLIYDNVMVSSIALATILLAVINAATFNALWR
jgi:hypothetical protein